MSGGFFRGTSADQDTRFSNKTAKLLKTQKFAPELDQQIDMTKVHLDALRPWIATRVTQLLGIEDEVVINYIYGMLEEKKNVDGKQMQILLTGFMEKNTGKFMRELWALLRSAEGSMTGIPQQLLEEKAEEARLKKAEEHRVMSEVRRKEDERRALEQEELKKQKEDGPVSHSDFANPASKQKAHSPSRGIRSRTLDGDHAKRNGTLDRRPSRSRSQSVSNASKGVSRSPAPPSKRRISRSISLSPPRRSRRSRSPPRRPRSPNYRRRSRSPARRARSPVRTRSPRRRRRSYSRSPRRRSPPRSPRRRRSPHYSRLSPRRRASHSPSPRHLRRSPRPRHHRLSSPARRRYTPPRHFSDLSPRRRPYVSSPRPASPSPRLRMRSSGSKSPPRHGSSSSSPHRLSSGSPANQSIRSVSPSGVKSSVQESQKSSPSKARPSKTSASPARQHKPSYKYHPSRSPSPKPSRKGAALPGVGLAAPKHSRVLSASLSPPKRRQTPSLSEGSPTSIKSESRSPPTARGPARKEPSEVEVCETEILPLNRKRTRSSSRESSLPAQEMQVASAKKPVVSEVKETAPSMIMDQTGRLDESLSRSSNENQHASPWRNPKNLDSDGNGEHGHASVDDKKAAKRRRKEERRLRKEEKRKKREERHKRKEERRASKAQFKGIASVTPPPDFDKRTLRSDDNDSADEGKAQYDEVTEMEQRKLENELRKKALESIRAKKVVSS